MHPLMQRTLILLKPDCVQRNLIGEIITRFERKGLKLVGMKMITLDDAILVEHYSHIADKAFFPEVRDFMKKSPVVALVLEGHSVVDVVRKLLGKTLGRDADIGTIRGDFSISIAANLVHASDSLETAGKEIARFFKDDELFDYQRVDVDFIYMSDEK